MIEDAELHRLRAAFAEPGPAPEPDACPEPERMWEAARGSLPPDEVRDLVEHVAACAACAEDWRLAVALQKEAGVPARTAPVRPPARFGPWIAAAAAAFAVGVVGVQLYQQEAGEPGYRGGRGGRGESAVMGPRVGATLPAEGFILAWEPIPGAASYELQVTAPDLTTLASAKGLQETSYQVPPSAFTGYPPGTPITWKVVATYPDGGAVESPAYRTRLR